MPLIEVVVDGAEYYIAYNFYFNGSSIELSERADRFPLIGRWRVSLGGSVWVPIFRHIDAYFAMSYK